MTEHGGSSKADRPRAAPEARADRAHAGQAIPGSGLISYAVTGAGKKDMLADFAIVEQTSRQARSNG